VEGAGACLEAGAFLVAGQTVPRLVRATDRSFDYFLDRRNTRCRCFAPRCQWCALKPVPVMLTLYHSRAGRGERPTDLASARLPANVAWLDLLNPVPDETSPQPLGSGRRNDPPPLLADDACQEPKVCRLTAGGESLLRTRL